MAFNDNWDGIARKQDLTEASQQVIGKYRFTPFTEGSIKGWKISVQGIGEVGFIEEPAKKNTKVSVAPHKIFFYQPFRGPGSPSLMATVYPGTETRVPNEKEVRFAPRQLLKAVSMWMDKYGYQKIETAKKESVEVTEQFKSGDKVKVPHKGKMVSGKIIRFDSGGTDKARQHGGGYVVDVGDAASIVVPKEKVQKEETVIADAGEQSLTEEVLSMKHFTDMGDLAKDIVAHAKDLKGKKNIGGFTPEQTTLHQIAGALRQAHQQQQDFFKGLMYSLEAIHKKSMSPSQHGNMEILRDLSTVMRELKKYQK